MDDRREELLAAARTARSHAYAPYSGYLVGAAVLDDRGRIHGGANVENVSYGLCLCAERSAVARAIAEGAKEIRAVAVATKDGGTPCGMCRQTLVEFAPVSTRVPIYCEDENGEVREYDLRELFPSAFESSAVERTPSPSERST